MLEAILSQGAHTNWAMWVSLAIVGASIVLYMTDRWSMELVSAGIIAALLLLFQVPGATAIDGTPVDPTAILQGFGNPALITIMALLVVGQGLFQTGALDGPSKAILRSYDKRPFLTLIMAFAAVFVTSAFINNTPVVIMFLPIMSAIAARMGIGPSRIMMPLSFVSVFAGMTTLIGTSTNLLAAEAFNRIEGVSIGFFELTSFGLILSSVGLLYLGIGARVFLPKREDMSDQIARGSGKHYVAQIEVSHGHFLSGKAPVAGMFPDLPGMTVRMIQRGEQAILPPFEDARLKPGDLVIVAATRQVLTDALATKPDLLEQMWRSGPGAEDTSGQPRSLLLAEAVIAPGSRMAGRTVELLGFRRLTRAVVLGIQRRSRMIRSQLNEIRLEAGDTLLLCAPADAFTELRQSKDIILLEWSSTEIPVTARAQAARVIALLTVIAAALEIVPILHASVAGAVAMIMAGCLNIRQATRSLDLRIFMLIGAALAMGIALEETGAMMLIAHTIVELTAPYGTIAVLSAIFFAVAILTNILSNAATAVLFTPVAISTAHELGADPLPFVLAVIYAANCCFATPIAYQTNLLVMGPGHYKFSDYLRYGGPLVILIWAVFTAVAPWRFGL
ncbi:MAG: SLC13 family permease [Pseudomonadota bacterium]